MKCILVQARYYLKKACRSEFYQKFRDNNIRELSKSEEGNLEYEIYKPFDSEDDICLTEVWKNAESQRQHHQTLHYAILSELKAKYVKKIEIKTGYFEELAPEENVSIH